MATAPPSVEEYPPRSVTLAPVSRPPDSTRNSCLDPPPPEDGTLATVQYDVTVDVQRLCEHDVGNERHDQFGTNGHSLRNCSLELRERCHLALDGGWRVGLNVVGVNERVGAGDGRSVVGAIDVVGVRVGSGEMLGFIVGGAPVGEDVGQSQPVQSQP